MAASIRASERGLEIVDIARRRKGWNRDSEIWLDEAGSIGKSTLNRFWARKAINRDNFVAICEAVGITDWESIADFNSSPVEAPPAAQLKDPVEPKEVTESLQSSSIIQPSNPFIPLTGRVDMQQLFFGREREIRRIFETLNSGSSVAVIGDREIGKSSLLWAICQQAESRLKLPRKPIYLNLQYVLDDDDFYEDMCYHVGIDVCKGSRLSRALSKQDSRLLLVLDEVEKMTWDGFTNQLRSQLRGFAEGGDAPLRLVVAASTSLDKLFPDSQTIGMTSPFQGICIEERINVWDEAMIREFISHRLAATAIRFQDEDITRIVRESGGHPKQLMQLCHQTYEDYKKKMP